MTTPAAERGQITRSERGQKYEALQARLAKTADSMGATIAKSISKDQLVQFMLGAVRKNPDILDCDPQSVALAMLQIGALGLPLGPLGYIYVIPYKTELQVIVGYKGMLELIRRSGQIQRIDARCVYEADSFKVSFGLNPDLHHTPGDHDYDPKKIIGAYVVVITKDGGEYFDWMTIREVEVARKRSRAKGGPWVTDYDRMVRKTVIRRLFSGGTVPASVEVMKVIEDEEVIEAADVGMQAFEDPPTRQLTSEIDGVNSPYIDAEPEREPARSESGGYGHEEATGPALASAEEQKAVAVAMEARGWLGNAIKKNGPVSGWTVEAVADMRAYLAANPPTEAKKPTTPPADDDGGAP